MTVGSIRTTTARRTALPWLTLAAGLAGLVLAAVLAIAGVRAFADLEAMQQDVHGMRSRLATLQTMNQKLDRLGKMQAQLAATQGLLKRTTRLLGATNRKLDLTNAGLGLTNAQLGRTNEQLGRTNAGVNAMLPPLHHMERQLQDIGVMRSDIHTMVHKISGSFLFRGVK